MLYRARPDRPIAAVRNPNQPPSSCQVGHTYVGHTYISHNYNPQSQSTARTHARLPACMHAHSPARAHAQAVDSRGSFVMWAFAGHNYVGHNYIGHNYIGHNYARHNYDNHAGHTYVGHSYTGGQQSRLLCDACIRGGAWLPS